MELIKENIRINQMGKMTTSQFAWEDDFNVPDHKPDVGRVITSEGNIKIEEMKPADSYLKVTGKLFFKVLYVTDTAVPSLASMEGVLPLEEMVYVEEGAEGEYQLRVNRMHLQVEVIHSRKLEIKAVTEFALHRERAIEEQATIRVDGDERIFQKSRQAEILQLCENKRDIYRIKEELHLPGVKENIEQLLWEEVSLRTLDTKLTNETLQLNGELQVFVIYQSQEGKTQWVEQTVPFEGQITCNGVDGNNYHHVYRALQDANLEVRMDEDGEMRCLGIEAVLELRILTYKEETMHLLEDVYSLDQKCNVETKRVFFEELIQQNHCKCRVTEALGLPEVKDEILQICHSGGTVQVERMEATEKGIQMEGILHVNFLYVKENDQIPFGVWSGMIPFSYLLECENASVDMRYDITYGLEQLSIELAGNGQIEVKAHIAFQSFLRKPLNIEMVDQLECIPYDPKEVADQPGIVGYIVKNGDDLWKLAKNYGTTEEGIMEINGLSSKELKSGDKLLIFKENMSIL